VKWIVGQEFFWFPGRVSYVAFWVCGVLFFVVVVVSERSKDPRISGDWSEFHDHSTQELCTHDDECVLLSLLLLLLWVVHFVVVVVVVGVGCFLEKKVAGRLFFESREDSIAAQDSVRPMPAHLLRVIFNSSICSFKLLKYNNKLLSLVNIFRAFLLCFGYLTLTGWFPIPDP